MLARYDGYCKVTHQRIIAGVTNIEKVNGTWQATQKQSGKYAIPAGAVVIMAWSDNDQDRWGDEIATHHVAFGDDDGEIVGTIWTCGTAESARQMAHEIFYSASGKLEDVIVELFN